MRGPVEVELANTVDLADVCQRATVSVGGVA
jgi:hypothetical protein